MLAASAARKESATIVVICDDTVQVLILMFEAAASSKFTLIAFVGYQNLYGQYGGRVHFLSVPNSNRGLDSTFVPNFVPEGRTILRNPTSSSQLLSSPNRVSTIPILNLNSSLRAKDIQKAENEIILYSVGMVSLC